MMDMTPHGQRALEHDMMDMTPHGQRALEARVGVVLGLEVGLVDFNPTPILSLTAAMYPVTGAGAGRPGISRSEAAQAAPICPHCLRHP